MTIRLMYWALMLAALGFATASAADTDQAKAASKMAYYAAGDKAAAEYMNAHAQCETLEAAAQLVCIEEAKLVQTRAKGTAEMQYRNTAQIRLKVSNDIANAEYRVAEAKCRNQPDSEKKVCMKRADVLRSNIVANAKAGEK